MRPCVAAPTPRTARVNFATTFLVPRFRARTMKLDVHNAANNKIPPLSSPNRCRSTHPARPRCLLREGWRVMNYFISHLLPTGPRVTVYPPLSAPHPHTPSHPTRLLDKGSRHPFTFITCVHHSIVGSSAQRRVLPLLSLGTSNGKGRNQGPAEGHEKGHRLSPRRSHEAGDQG